MKKTDDDAFLDEILDYVTTSEFKQLTGDEIYKTVQNMVRDYQSQGRKYSDLLANFSQLLETRSVLPRGYSSVPITSYAKCAELAREDKAAWDSAVAKLKFKKPVKPASPIATLPTFDDLAAGIIGQNEAKKFLKMALTSKDSYRFQTLGIKPPSGVLLYGPPGTGKTMLARLVAEHMALQAGVRPGTVPDDHIGFFVAGVLKDKYSGGGEKNVIAMFERCRDFYRRFGRKAVLFIDEAETLLSARTDTEWGAAATYMVPTFLSQMDNVDVNKNRANPFIVLATNRPEDLDPAVLRDGRIDERINVGLPSDDDVKALVKFHMANAMFYTAEFDIEQCASAVLTQAKNTVIFPIRDILLSHIDPQDTGNIEGITTWVKDPTLADELTGATVAGLCNRIKRAAFVADHDSIEEADVTTAIEAMRTEARTRGVSYYIAQARDDGSRRKLKAYLSGERNVLNTVSWTGTRGEMN